MSMKSNQIKYVNEINSIQVCKAILQITAMLRTAKDYYKWRSINIFDREPTNPNIRHCEEEGFRAYFRTVECSPFVRDQQK